MIASPFRRAVPITFLDLCPVNGGCWPEIALQPGRDYEIPSRNYRDVRFYGSFPGNRAEEGGTVRWRARRRLCSARVEIAFAFPRKLSQPWRM